MQVLIHQNESIELSRRPVRRWVSRDGFPSTAGGEWVARCEDGREYVHRTKSLVVNLAKAHIRGEQD